MADDRKAPEPEPAPRPGDDAWDDAWIERVVNLGRSFGVNQVRLRWKLIRWREARRRKARQREQVLAHITYAHKTCHQCGSVQDKHEPVCTRCGARLSRRGVQVLRRIGLAVPVAVSMSTVLAVALIAAYGKTWIAGGRLAGPSVPVLVAFGGRWAPLIADEPWRLLTAVFLHAGPLHLAFNVLAIATAGPRIEELYGRWTMLALFVATGVVANLVTLQVSSGAGVGIGASGGLMGLTGAAAAAGHRLGTRHGRAVRDAMLAWMAYTFAYGWLLHADNWAHLFGALSGGAFGLAARPRAWMSRALIPLRGLVGAVGVVAMVGAVLIIVTRHPAPRDRREPDVDPGAEAVADDAPVLESYAPACARLYAGDAGGAVAAAAASFHDDRRDRVTRSSVAGVCAEMQKLRDRCKATLADPIASARDADADPAREACASYRRLFELLPPDPRR